MDPDWIPHIRMAESALRECRVRNHSAPGGSEGDMTGRRLRLGGVSGPAPPTEDATVSRGSDMRPRGRSDGSQFRLRRFSKRSGQTSQRTEYEPDMSVLKQRVLTYESWPPDTPVLPLELARAGFFYQGNGDKVRCFSCKLVLHRWEQGDSPLEEHLRFLPQCQFVRNIAGLQEAEQWDDLVDRPLAQNVLRLGFTEEDVRQEALLLIQSGHDVTFERLVDGIITRKETSLDKGFPCSQENASSAGSPQASTSHHEVPAGGNDNPDNDLVDAIGKISIDDVIAKQLIAKAPGRQKSTTNQRDVLVAMEEENDKLRMLATCKVCMEGDISVLFLPCRHLVCCKNCSKGLNNCPVCRVNVTGTIRAYLA